MNVYRCAHAATDTALAQHRQLLQYKQPNKNDLRLLKQWLAKYTQFYSTAEYDQWFGTEEHERDLITLSARYQNVDPLTRWVFGVCIPFWHGHVSMRYKKIFKSAQVRALPFSTWIRLGTEYAAYMKPWV